MCNPAIRVQSVCNLHLLIQEVMVAQLGFGQILHPGITVDTKPYGLFDVLKHINANNYHRLPKCVHNFFQKKSLVPLNFFVPGQKWCYAKSWEFLSPFQPHQQTAQLSTLNFGQTTRTQNRIVLGPPRFFFQTYLKTISGLSKTLFLVEKD